MSNPRNIKQLLAEKKLAPHKKLGQNFLIHRATAEKIARMAGITEEDTVVELGVGFGALTQPMAETAAKVIGLEIDAGIVAWHEEQQDLPENVQLIHQDILQADFRKLAEQTGARVKIVANLPYSVSTPLLFKLIDHQDDIAWAVLMLQKEVSQRLTATINTKNYGILSVIFNSCAAIQTLMEVGPGQFHPRPKVDSQVVRIVFHPKPEKIAKLPDFNGDLLRKIVRSAFQQRRKTLVNALSAGLQQVNKDNILQALEKTAIPPKVRAENVSVEKYIALANALSKPLHSHYPLP